MHRSVDIMSAVLLQKAREAATHGRTKAVKSSILMAHNPYIGTYEAISASSVRLMNSIGDLVYSEPFSSPGDDGLMRLLLIWVMTVPDACAAECNPREDAGAQLLKIIVTHRCGGGKAGLRHTHETGTYCKLLPSVSLSVSGLWAMGTAVDGVIHMSMRVNDVGHSGSCHGPR